MISKFLGKILGDYNQKELSKIDPLVAEINHLEARFKDLDDQALKQMTTAFKERIAGGEPLDSILPEAFAVVRETARRTMGMRHYDVQLYGGIALHQGRIAEMKTGEGKTLVATLPMYLNALSGKGAHLITVNDYLAKRDAEWMATIYRFLGLTTGTIIHGISNQDRKNNYAADITYGTNNEFGFDYLRDNMATSKDQIVQRNLNFAIVDEADSILIDEARTPLIISAPAEESTSKYKQYASLVSRLEENVHFDIDEKLRACTLTDEGIARMENLLNMQNIYTEAGFQEVHHIEQALKAHNVFRKDIDYVVKDGEIVIVDEFTGRLMPGRRYSEGLHQAIEAKEQVEVKRESKTLATITFQNYFRLYEKLSGMTGTAITEAAEFHSTYELETLVIPTHKPVIRKDLPDKVYKSEKGKFLAVVEEIKTKHENGQPVLVGSVSIEKSEALSTLLKQEGISHNVLNAKHHEKEAHIVAQAGRLGAVTIATNMAGRGTDIMLGGNPEELTLSDGIEPSSEEFNQRFTHFQELCKQEKEDVLNAGGLAIIGTERHESRRIDNQLRGRSGRQGDPGSSEFFVSMEDRLMRLFGSERMYNMMEKLGIPDDMPIENKMLTGAIENAQKKVEGHHFDMRKHLLEYDEVLNKQRTIIYSKRRDILFHEDIRSITTDVVTQEIEELCANHQDPNGNLDTQQVLEAVNAITPIDAFTVPVDTDTDMAISALTKELLRIYDERIQEISNEIFSGIEKQVYLRAIDTLWMEHLDEMTHLRDSVSMHGYAQRDPLMTYKQEAYEAFERLLRRIRNNFVHTIFKVRISESPVIQTQTTPMQTNEDAIEQNLTGTSAKDPIATSVSSSKPELSRNAPCHCGSGKKYKRCHGK